MVIPLAVNRDLLFSVVFGTRMKIILSARHETYNCTTGSVEINWPVTNDAT